MKYYNLPRHRLLNVMFEYQQVPNLLPKLTCFFGAILLFCHSFLQSCIRNPHFFEEGFCFQSWFQIPSQLESASQNQRKEHSSGTQVVPLSSLNMSQINLQPYAISGPYAFFLTHAKLPIAFLPTLRLATPKGLDVRLMYVVKNR